MTARLAALCLLCAACAGDPENVPAGRLFTVEDMLRLARTGGSVGPLPATMFAVPRGQLLMMLSPPFSDAPAVQRGDQDGLNVFTAFSEGRPAAYTTTEAWIGFPKVWVQPLYLPVVGFDAEGRAQALPGAQVVFGIGTRSRFYSPYWQIFYLVVPPGTAPNRFKSAKDVLDSGLPLVAGGGTFCAIAPPEVSLAEAQGSSGPVRPIFGDAVKVNLARGWVEGEQVYYLDFGRNRFNWDDKHVFEEAALFDFTVRGTDGSLKSLGLPKVGGTGPLRSGIPARFAGGKPQFGALWRVYQTLLPSGAGAFIPSGRAALRGQYPGLAPAIAAEIEARGDVDEYLLRVAGDPTCFQSAARFPGDCRWLDSQAAIEGAIPDSNIRDTGMLVTCPFLTFDGQAVLP